jgi:predicted unusual protein kinase regulating ubiquinone biosynthesis (AarF/ABC1/UbiB family)
MRILTVLLRGGALVVGIGGLALALAWHRLRAWSGARPYLGRDPLIHFCERAGGGIPKIGQLLSTRSDLLPPAICERLAPLQDRVSPLSERTLNEQLPPELSDPARFRFDPVPIACGTIAQVHRAERVICMEFCDGLRRVTDPRVDDDQAQGAVLTGVRALYRMLFCDGLVHCDLHPGNMLVSPGGYCVILDAGLITEVEDRSRYLFARFVRAICSADATTASRVSRAATRDSLVNTGAASDQVVDEVARPQGHTTDSSRCCDTVGCRCPVPTATPPALSYRAGAATRPPPAARRSPSAVRT